MGAKRKPHTALPFDEREDKDDRDLFRLVRLAVPMKRNVQYHIQAPYASVTTLCVQILQRNTTEFRAWRTIPDSEDTIATVLARGELCVTCLIRYNTRVARYLNKLKRETKHYAFTRRAITNDRRS